MTDTQPAAQAEQITIIPIDQLHESPFNPRKTFREEGLQELAADIKAIGVMSPLRVRPRVPALFRDIDGPNAQAGFELVFGHRRLRASSLAGLTTVPCIVRSMSDEQVKRAQLSENLEREDVHPFEEAEGFEALMREHNLTVEDLMQQFGKSRTYIYTRLKLLQAIPAVRAACLAGKFGAESALLIARWRHPKLQERALKAIEAKYLSLEDGGKQSYRRIKALLNEMFTLDLKKAIFEPEDITLVPAAGACSTCDKLSGNAPEFQDLTERQEVYPGHYEGGRSNLCTDPTCWDTKHKAHLVRQAEKMRAEGKVVVDGNKAKAALSADGKTVKGAYVGLEEVKRALKAAGKKSADLPVVNIQDQRTGKTVQAVAAAELKTIGVQKPAAPTSNGRRASQTMSPEEKAKQEAEKRENALRANRLMRTCMAKLAEAPRSADEFELVLRWALEKVNTWDDEAAWIAEYFGHKDLGDLVPALPSMSRDDKGRLLIAIAMVENEGYWLSGMQDEVPAGVATLAELHGVDVEAAMSAPMPDEVVEGASTPSLAAQAQEKAKPPRGVKYFDPQTGQSWTGRGLKPAWLKSALDDGCTLADFEVKDEAVACGAGDDADE